MALLQPASFGLAASLIMWAHHIAVVVAGNLAGLPDYAPLNDAIFFGCMALWCLALWAATRHRDAEAVEERQCEARAAAGAAHCLSLVHAMLPPAVMEDLRDRLIQQLPLTVAYSYDQAFMLQSDIVVSSSPGLLAGRALFRVSHVDGGPRGRNRTSWDYRFNGFALLLKSIK